MRKTSDYALYRGDDFIDLGKPQELAERNNVTIKTIYWLATEQNHKRDKGNRLVAIKIEDDEEDGQTN